MTVLIRRLVVIGSVLLLAGCVSQRGTSTLKEVPGAAAKLAGLNFRVAVVEEGNNTNPAPLQQLMSKDYPQLFSDDLEAIPLLVRLKSETDSSQIGAFIGGFFTLGTIPVPTYTGFAREVGVTPWSGAGAVLPESVIRYTRRDHLWMTIFTPLGLIPMPGWSDMDRATATILSANDTTYIKKQQAFNDLNMQKAVLSALAGMDQSVLRRTAAERKAMPALEVDIDGRHYSGRLLPAFSQNLRQPGGADQYQVVLRNTEQHGENQVITTHHIPVARRSAAGGWEVLRHYLSFSARPMVATALLADGVPARPLVLPVEQPPLADFIDVPDTRPESAAPVRWSNNILLLIKNDPLAAELAAKPLPELRDLVTRLESSLLDLNERVGRANDRAQQAIEKGESPDAQRELAVVYRQRSEILKAILGVVRQESAARGTP